MLETPRGNRLHIALFGRRNAGKSSLINALTNQALAIVSAVAGTTTDPVYKSMEILPIGPVVVIDTAGLDDVGELGRLRIAKSLEVLRKSDLVLLIVDAVFGVGQPEQDLAARCAEQKIPFILVLIKSICRRSRTLFWNGRKKSSAQSPPWRSAPRTGKELAN